MKDIGKKLLDIARWYSMPADHFNTIKEAVELLDRPRCEDAISRQAAIDAISRIGLCKCSTKEVQAVDECLRSVENLPSISTEKTGHWIEHERNGIKHIECSECSVWFLRSYLVHNSYCPNCGAKMREVEE